MWEITIVGKEEDKSYFELLEEQINVAFGKDVIVAIINNNCCYCSIATNNKAYINMLKHIIVETIIKISKVEYFLDNLKILADDKELNKFILISFAHLGLEEESRYVVNNIKLSKKIHIRSFVKFKLSKLESVWNTTIRYISRRLRDVDENLIYLEFLRFLAINCDPKIDIIYLVDDNDSVQILDKQKQILSNMPKSDEIGVVVNLILYAPKKLVINCFSSLSQKVADLITYIFEDRISMIL